MGMNLFGMLGLATSGKKATLGQDDNQAASLVAARELAVKKQRSALAAGGLTNSLNATSPLGLTGSGQTPNGYKTLLGG